MTENLPLTIFVVGAVFVHVVNATYVIRGARMAEDDHTRRRSYLLSALALIAYAVFMYLLVRIGVNIL